MKTFSMKYQMLCLQFSCAQVRVENDTCSSNSFTSYIKLITVQPQHWRNQDSVEVCLTKFSCEPSENLYQICVHFLFHGCSLGACDLETGRAHRENELLVAYGLGVAPSTWWWCLTLTEKKPTSQCNELMFRRFEIWSCAVSTQWLYKPKLQWQFSVVLNQIGLWTNSNSQNHGHLRIIQPSHLNHNLI